MRNSFESLFNNFKNFASLSRQSFSMERLFGSLKAAFAQDNDDLKTNWIVK